MFLLSYCRRLLNRPGATGWLVFAWKFSLLLLTAQPIPANDAFGYDGAVVNYLRTGHYCNPCLIIPFPFSGAHIYSIYPPVYQGCLCLWMSLMGTSALAAMWFHLVLFGVYLVTLLGIFRQLQTPAWAVNLGCLFLLAITFNDRPDDLAHVWGMLAVYGWVRAQAPAGVRFYPWAWFSVGMGVLACATTPELGGLYAGWLILLFLSARAARLAPLPWLPLGGLVLMPVALVAAVKFGRPDLWAGFMEHAGQTPSLKLGQFLSATDVIKVIRTIPALLLMGGVLAYRWRRGVFPNWRTALPGTEACSWLLVGTGLVVSLGMVAGVVGVFTANWILFLAFFQPLLTGLFLAQEVRRRPADLRWWLPVTGALVVLVAVRALGQSTWGLACAVDMNYSTAQTAVCNELARLPAGATVVMSTAYLYAGTRDERLHFIHEDWTHRVEPPTGPLAGDTRGLLKLKPALLILSQFDYYRRYQQPLAELQAMPAVVVVHTRNHARVPAPDSFRLSQQVLQHVAWAPVVVTLDWQ